MHGQISKKRFSSAAEASSSDYPSRTIRLRIWCGNWSSFFLKRSRLQKTARCGPRNTRNEMGFIAFLIVSAIHMVEEYFYPGGFMDTIKRLNPRFAPFVTVPRAIIINSLQLALCGIAMCVGKSTTVFRLSVAGLLLLNGLVHIAGCIRARGYSPGVITGTVSLLTDICVCICCFSEFWSANRGRRGSYFCSGLGVSGDPDRVSCAGERAGANAFLNRLK